MIRELKKFDGDAALQRLEHLKQEVAALKAKMGVTESKAQSPMSDVAASGTAGPTKPEHNGSAESEQMSVNPSPSEHSQEQADSVDRRTDSSTQRREDAKTQESKEFENEDQEDEK